MSIAVASGETGCAGSSLVDAVDADAVGGGGGSVLPGPCISPPNANVALEITTMAANRKHRSLFIV